MGNMARGLSIKSRRSGMIMTLNDAIKHAEEKSEEGNQHDR